MTLAISLTNSKHSVRFSNGISCSTGKPLEDLGPEDFGGNEIVPPEEEAIAQTKHTDAKEKWGLIDGVDGGDLSQAGWGLIFPAATPVLRVNEILDALAPLIELRKKEMTVVGLSGGEPETVKIFRDKQGYQSNETGIEWLSRQEVSMSPVDPRMKVPFYLLIIGSPEEIPYEFQYMLDIYWGVGRLAFNALAEYRCYAENIVAYETAKLLPTERSIAIFATRHASDDATTLFHDEVALPLVQGDQRHKALGFAQGFDIRPFLAESATKSALIDLLAGRSSAGRSALLFTGAHGLVVDADNARQRDFQGALICQDWKTPGKISAKDWASAADIPADGAASGLIHFSFACYSAGTPEFDNYGQHRKKPKRIAPAPFIAKLPQELLLRGALAVCGHVDRAWSYSFHASASGSQIQGFRDVLTGILRGKRIGLATDQFNIKWAALSVELAEVQEEMRNKRKIPAQYLADLWIARNDARNYMVLGDPAVRLRIESLLNPMEPAKSNN